MQKETTGVRTASSLVHRAAEPSRARGVLSVPRDRVLDTNGNAVRPSNSTAATLLRETEPLSTLPEKWDTNFLEDEFRQHTSQIRNRTLRRKTPRRLVRRQEARGSNVVDSLQWGLKRGAFLGKTEQQFLALKYQRWQKIKQKFNELTSNTGRQPTPEQWALSCDVSESDLRTVLSDGPKAADLLLASVEGLLKKTCQHFITPAWEFEDMFLEAQSIWLEAARSFNPEKGAGLTTFALMFLRQRLSLRMNAMSDTMSRSPNQVREERILMRVKSDFQETHGREPSMEELSKLLRKPLARTKFLSKGLRSIVSFDQVLSQRDAKREDTATVGENIEEESHLGEGYDANLLPNLRRDLAAELEQSMNELIKDPRDREILRMYYQLGDTETPVVSYRDIGDHLGISYESVRQRMKKALSKLGGSSKVTAHLQDYHVAEILDY